MTPDEVLDWVENKFGFSKAILVGKSRNGNVVRARHSAMFLVVEKCGLSFPQTGRVFKKDHSTVLSAYHKIKGLVQDGKIDLQINHYEPKIKNKLEFDNIMDDSLEIIKQKFNRSFSKNPFDTMIALCNLAKELDKLGDKKK